jgi:hypothetical protein
MLISGDRDVWGLTSLCLPLPGTLGTELELSDALSAWITSTLVTFIFNNTLGQQNRN